MTKGEEGMAALIGSLILEQSSLEKQISALRDELSERARIFARIGRLLIFRPECLAFDGQIVDEKFAGESAIERAAMQVDSMLADLRSAIARQDECTAELAELGIDLEENERQQNLRASRALHHPANAGYEGKHDGAVPTAVGFGKPQKPSDEKEKRGA